MRFFGLWERGTERASCMALREAARVSVWERVPWCSKSFSPRRGRVGWFVVLERCELDPKRPRGFRWLYWERVDKKRKS